MMMSDSSQLIISTIIPVHNGGEAFRRCLLGLIEAVPSPHEIIEVVNGDTDGSARAAEEFGTTISKIPTSIVAGVLILLLLTFNAPLYRFFWQKRGLWFAVQTIPLH